MADLYQNLNQIFLTLQSSVMQNVAEGRSFLREEWSAVASVRVWAIGTACTAAKDAVELSNWLTGDKVWLDPVPLML